MSETTQWLAGGNFTSPNPEPKEELNWECAVTVSLFKSMGNAWDLLKVKEKDWPFAYEAPTE